MAAVYEVMVQPAATIRSARIELLTKIADIHERRLMNPEAAFDAYTRALQLDPTNPEVVAHLDRLAEATVKWPELAAVYEAELPNIHDSRLQVETLLRVARIYEEETRETDRAIAAYRKVADIEPDRPEGLQALDRLYTRTERWPELAEVLRGEVRLASTEDEIIALNFRLAQLQELAIGDLPKARGGLPGHPERQPRPPRDPRGAGAPAEGRAACSTRRPRCWSRCTAWARSGTSWSRSTSWSSSG